MPLRFRPPPLLCELYPEAICRRVQRELPRRKLRSPHASPRRQRQLRERRVRWFHTLAWEIVEALKNCSVEAFVHEQSTLLQPISLHPLNDSEIVPDSHSAEPDVQIREANPEQTKPRPKHVAAI